MDAIDLKIEKDKSEEPQVGAATNACTESLAMAHGVKVIAWSEIAVFANFYAHSTRCRVVFFVDRILAA